MHAVVVANGDLHPEDRRSILEADLLVAADGGAQLAAAAGRLPSVIAGDLDSVSRSAELDAAIRGGSVRIDRRSSEKDETDTEIALDAAVAGGALRVDVVGALGGSRVDHELANLLMLADRRYGGVQVSVVRGTTRVRPLHGGDELELKGSVGDTVSLIPVGGDAIGVDTVGLAYALDGDTLRFGRARGVSNRIAKRPARVRLERGVMLVVELPAELPAEGGPA